MFISILIMDLYSAQLQCVSVWAQPSFKASLNAGWLSFGEADWDSLGFPMMYPQPRFSVLEIFPECLWFQWPNWHCTCSNVGTTGNISSKGFLLHILTRSRHHIITCCQNTNLSVQSRYFKKIYGFPPSCHSNWFTNLGEVASLCHQTAMPPPPKKLFEENLGEPW